MCVCGTIAYYVSYLATRHIDPTGHSSFYTVSESILGMAAEGTSEAGEVSAAGEAGPSGPGPGETGPSGPGPGETGARDLHARSFKLRFASQREPGRSYVSLVKPLGLPATVTGKFYVREQAGAADEGTRRALRRIEDMFGRGPRDKYDAPLTSSQVVGWWAAGRAPAPRGDRRLAHHVRDSAWLKARLCVLAADDKLKQR